MEITLDKRTEKNLAAFCKANGIDAKEYAAEAVSERLALDMFGDMNDMIKKPEPKKRSTRKKADTKPSVGEEKVPGNEKVDEPQSETDAVKDDVCEVHQVDAEEKKPVKRKRSLKVK